MRRALGLFGVRLASVLALAVSAALLVDYVGRAPTFCGLGSGCAAVRSSGYGYLSLLDMNLPLPLLGLLGFALLLGVALTRGLSRWTPLVGALGGVIGLSLFALQWLKTRPVVLAVRDRRRAERGRRHLRASCTGAARADAHEEFGLRWGAWPLLAVLALLAPLACRSCARSRRCPRACRSCTCPARSTSSNSPITSAPFCRRLHPQLSAVIDSYAGKVNFTRLNLPLKSHQFARAAAQAQVCARAQGKGDAMGGSALSGRRSASNQEPRASQGAGASSSRLTTIASAPAPPTRSSKPSRKSCSTTAYKGLPTTYVGAKTILGAQPEEVFRDAFERAERGRRRARSSGVGLLAARARARRGDQLGGGAFGVLHSDMEHTNSNDSAVAVGGAAHAPVPFEVFKALPKTDLHVHLDGSLRLETILELAQAQKVELPANDLEGLRAAIGSGSNFGSLIEYLRGFGITLRVMQTEAALERIAFELAEDAHRENVRYMEVRYAPMLHTPARAEADQGGRSRARRPAARA